MIRLADERLYCDVAYCLDHLRNLAPPSPPPSGPRIPVHFYWRGPFGRKAAFALKSFLATQNLMRLEAWLWLDQSDGAPAAHGPQLDALSALVRLMTYDPAELARDTPLALAQDLIAAPTSAARSDAFRLTVLHRHGGLYIDMDTLLLRDLTILLDSPSGNRPFCYCWSGESVATNAISRLERESTLGIELMAHARSIGSCHPRQLLRHADHDGLDLLELPCPFFDPLWLHFDRWNRFRQAPFDRFSDFFRPFGWFYRRQPGLNSIRDFFPGAFAYQWHGLWRAREAANSYFGMFENEIDGLLAEKFSAQAPAAGLSRTPS
jgi:hypothetical protein